MRDTMNERIWADQARSLMPEYVRVIGRVIGRVSISDLDREVLYNQVLDIPASEARKSKDLLDARDKKWIDILYGNEYLQKSIPVQQIQQNFTQQVQPQLNLNDLKAFASEIAESAANKSVSSIRDMIQDMSNKINSGSSLDASQVVGELLKRLPSQQTAQGSVSQKPDNLTSNVFIDVDSEDIEKRANLNDIGKVKKEKGNIMSSIDKMKQFKKQGNT
jgi:hypothetical protein